MKTRIFVTLIALLIWPASILKSQPQPEQLNLPGDNLNLYAVMKLFQESETLELFEQKLNDQDLRINNLDLNGDNYIDYIKVTDNIEKGVHYIVLQVAITATENQDVAVFVVRKDPKGDVVIQLIGDEALYGKYYIVEPYYDTDKGNTPNPGYYGNYNNSNDNDALVVHHTTTYEVATWPMIRFIFLPTYVVWHSPWYWGYYPTYWHPWSPWYWHEYYGYHYHWHHYYYGHFHHGNHNRFDHWNDYYYGPRRKTSVTVSNRMSRGEFAVTYSKPETLRDGSEYFKKRNPDKVTKDMRDPELKDIKTADRFEKKQDKVGNTDKTSTVKNQNNSKNWSKPGKVETKSNSVKEEKKHSEPANVKKNHNESKTGGIKNERKSETRKEESKSQSKSTVKEPSGKNKSDSKNAGNSQRSGRK